MQGGAADRHFKMDTLRRRMHFLINKVENDDSTNAKRFNTMEIEALQSAISAMEKEDRHDVVADGLVKLVTPIETGTDEEFTKAVDNTHKVIDRYGL